jgi:hypothetical protein
MMGDGEEIFDAERQVLARLADALLGDEQLATDVFGLRCPRWSCTASRARWLYESR